MAKRKQKPQTPPNFVDLRAEALKPSKNLIDDVIRPAFVASKLSAGRLAAIAVGVLVIIVIVVIASSGGDNKMPNPVPKSVQQSVSFPVYYPDSRKLPAGYTIKEDSFSSGGGAVVFVVQIPQNQQITVSEQKLPTQAELATFHTQRLPLHTDVKTPIGTARVSALNNQSFTSLPTDKTWLLISAPYAIDQNKLNQFLRSLTY